MTTLLITHPDFLRHETPEGHPERADRLRAIDEYLSAAVFSSLVRQQARPVALENAELVHSQQYLSELSRLSNLAKAKNHAVSLDPDTFMTPETLSALCHGIGATQAAVEAVVTGDVKNAFCAVRPPGHHAEHDMAMGFCLINNAAFAARYAQQLAGIERVAIIDWDVHHGNGTQDIFWSDASVMYASTHEMPLFPGTGHADEKGEHGTIVNVPLHAGGGSEEFRAAFKHILLPRLKEFAAQFYVISAGFDAHYLDPLGHLDLTEEDFSWATNEIMDLAEQTANGRIVSILEGGYDLQGLGSSVAAHVKTLMNI